MASFGEIFRGVESHQARLTLLGSLMDLGRGNIQLELIGEGKTAEIYEIKSERETHPKLVVKTPPFRRIDDTNAFDAGCFSILREMDALRRIGASAFVNMAQSAKSVLGVPALIFTKRHTDLRQLITADITSGDLFVRLAVLQMVALGLERAQEKGVIIHQDLKPENVLIDYIAAKFEIEGEFPALAIPRINDFEFTNRIIDGRLRGFRPYLPAEHYDKQGAELGENNRYDIYSLAIIAHELLTFGYHPIPNPDDSRGLHCSEFVEGTKGPYRSEEKWKKFARKPSSEKILPSISDRILAKVLSAALDPDFRNRPTATEMANAFRDAMQREDHRQAERVKLTIEFFGESDETGTGAQADFPALAKAIIDEAPPDPLNS